MAVAIKKQLHYFSTVA